MAQRATGQIVKTRAQAQLCADPRDDIGACSVATAVLFAGCFRSVDSPPAAAEHWHGKDESPRLAALRRIAEHEARITRQKVIIAQLNANGAATGTAKRLLATMEDALTALRSSLNHYSN
jgi:hypothetical protein